MRRFQEQVGLLGYPQHQRVFVNKLTDASANKRVDYSGRAIIIHDNRDICSHAGFWTDNLKRAFRMGEEPWIDPDGATVEELIRVVRKVGSRPTAAIGVTHMYGGNGTDIGHVAGMSSPSGLDAGIPLAADTAKSPPLLLRRG